MENYNENVHHIPANYTDSGKMLGGLVSPRNLIEAILISATLGYIEVALIPMTLMLRVTARRRSLGRMKRKYLLKEAAVCLEKL